MTIMTINMIPNSYFIISMTVVKEEVCLCNMQDILSYLKRHIDCWSCRKKIDLILQEDLNLGTEVDIEENDLQIDTITNLQICKHFYGTIYKTGIDNLQEMLVNSQLQYQNAIDPMDSLNCWTVFTILKNI